MSEDDSSSQSNPRDSDTSGRGRNKRNKRVNRYSRQAKVISKRNRDAQSADATIAAGLDFDSMSSANCSSNCSFAMPATASDSDQSAWSLDTCVSFHLTGDRNSFVSFHTDPCPDKIDDTAGIRDASGRIATVSGWGTVLLQTSDGHVKLSHVRYVPSFSLNLLSYAQLEDQGHTRDCAQRVQYLYSRRLCSYSF